MTNTSQKPEWQHFRDLRTETQWPEKGLKELQEQGFGGMVISPEWGGMGLSYREQLETYEALAASDAALALVQTQHDGACLLLQNSDAVHLRERVLRSCAEGKCLLTVGISQLTTSHQYTDAVLQAEPAPDGYVLNGFIPWVTSATDADCIVTGAVLPDGQQLLVCLPTHRDGVVIEEPMELIGLTASWTSRVECHKVHLGHGDVIRGPQEKVLELRAPVKGFTVGAVGLGMCRRLLESVQELVEERGERYLELYGRMQEKFAEVRSSFYDTLSLRLAGESVQVVDLRSQINVFLQRLSCTSLTLAKGTGYLQSHPVGRLVREAHFLLVWSATDELQEATLQRIWS